MLNWFGKVFVNVCDKNTKRGRKPVDLRRRPMLEGLEERVVPAFSATLSGGAVVFTGDTTNDSLIFTVDGSGNLKHNRAGDTGFASNIDLNSAMAGIQSKNLADITSLTADAGLGTDTIDLNQDMTFGANVGGTTIDLKAETIQIENLNTNGGDFTAEGTTFSTGFRKAFKSVGAVNLNFTGLVNLLNDLDQVHTVESMTVVAGSFKSDSISSSGNTIDIDTGATGGDIDIKNLTATAAGADITLNASAPITFFNSQSAWEAVNPGFSSDDFTSVPFPGRALQADTVEDVGLFDLTYTTDTGADNFWNRLDWFKDQLSLQLTGFPNQVTQSMTFTFDTPIRAFGFNVEDLHAARETWQFDVNGEIFNVADVIDSASTAPKLSGFAGFVTDSPISSITVTGLPLTDWFNQDDIIKLNSVFVATESTLTAGNVSVDDVTTNNGDFTSKGANFDNGFRNRFLTGSGKVELYHTGAVNLGSGSNGQVNEVGSFKATGSSFNLGNAKIQTSGNTINIDMTNGGTTPAGGNITTGDLTTSAAGASITLDAGTNGNVSVGDVTTNNGDFTSRGKDFKTGFREEITTVSLPATAPLGSESFLSGTNATAGQYIAGASLLGQNPSVSGFSGTWTNEGDITATSSGLSVTVSGGTIGSSSTGAAERTGTAGGNVTQADRSMSGVGASTYFASGLMKLNSFNNSASFSRTSTFFDFGVRGFGFGFGTDGTNSVFIGVTGNNDTNQPLTGSTASIGETYLFLAKAVIDHTGGSNATNDTLTVWVGNSASFDTTSEATLTATALASRTFSGVSIAGTISGTPEDLLALTLASNRVDNKAIFDEINIGTTLGSVLDFNGGNILMDHTGDIIIDSGGFSQHTGGSFTAKGASFDADATDIVTTNGAITVNTTNSPGGPIKVGDLTANGGLAAIVLNAGASTVLVTGGTINGSTYDITGHMTVNAFARVVFNVDSAAPQKLMDVDGSLTFNTNSRIKVVANGAPVSIGQHVLAEVTDGGLTINGFVLEKAGNESSAIDAVFADLSGDPDLLKITLS